MIQVNIHQAKTQLSRLIASAEAGEEVVIARDGVPVVRMQPLAPAVTGKKRNFSGSMMGEITLPPDEEWARMDQETARQVLEGSIFPDDEVEPKVEAAE